MCTSALFSQTWNKNQKGNQSFDRKPTRYGHNYREEMGATTVVAKGACARTTQEAESHGWRVT